MKLSQLKSIVKEAVKEAIQLAENTARGGIPTYNTNASDTALKAALDFNKDLSSEARIKLAKEINPEIWTSSRGDGKKEKVCYWDKVLKDKWLYGS